MSLSAYNPILVISVMALLAYIWGSIPWGIIIAKQVKGIDLREYGSGKIGMTNVIRTVGIKSGILVLILDFSKGILPIILARLVIDSPGVEVALGLGSMFGHNWSIFIRFHGGGGILTGSGILAIISPLSVGLALAAAIPCFIITRYVSLGSLMGASSASITIIALCATGNLDVAYIYFGLVGLGIVVFRHKSNIQLLMRGKERKIGEPAKKITPGQTSRGKK